MNPLQTQRPFKVHNIIPYPDGFADTELRFEGETMHEFEHCPATFTRGLMRALNQIFQRGVEDAIEKNTRTQHPWDLARWRQLHVSESSRFFLRIQSDVTENGVRRVTGDISCPSERGTVLAFEDAVPVDDARRATSFFQMAYEYGLHQGREFVEARDAINLAVS